MELNDNVPKTALLMELKSFVNIYPTLPYSCPEHYIAAPGPPARKTEKDEGKRSER